MDIPKFSGLKSIYLLSHGFCGATTFSPGGLTGEGPTSVLIHIVAGRMQFLKVCWNEIFRTLLALGWSWLVPYQVGFSSMAAYFTKARREFANKREVIIFWKLVMEMTSNHLSFISQRQIQPMLKGRCNYTGCEHQEWG